jgi:hypothetical protein
MQSEATGRDIWVVFQTDFFNFDKTILLYSFQSGAASLVPENMV